MLPGFSRLGSANAENVSALGGEGGGGMHVLALFCCCMGRKVWGLRGACLVGRRRQRGQWERISRMWRWKEVPATNALLR